MGSDAPSRPGPTDGPGGEPERGADPSAARVVRNRHGLEIGCGETPVALALLVRLGGQQRVSPTDHVEVALQDSVP